MDSLNFRGDNIPSFTANRPQNVSVSIQQAHNTLKFSASADTFNGTIFKRSGCSSGNETWGTANGGPRRQ